MELFTSNSYNGIVLPPIKASGRELRLAFVLGGETRECEQAASFSGVLVSPDVEGVHFADHSALQSINLVSSVDLKDCEGGDSVVVVAPHAKVVSTKSSGDVHIVTCACVLKEAANPEWFVRLVTNEAYHAQALLGVFARQQTLTYHDRDQLTSFHVHRQRARMSNAIAHTFKSSPKSVSDSLGMLKEAYANASKTRESNKMYIGGLPVGVLTSRTLLAFRTRNGRQFPVPDLKDAPVVECYLLDVVVNGRCSVVRLGIESWCKRGGNVMTTRCTMNVHASTKMVEDAIGHSDKDKGIQAGLRSIKRGLVVLSKSLDGKAYVDGMWLDSTDIPSSKRTRDEQAAR